MSTERMFIYLEDFVFAHQGRELNLKNTQTDTEAGKSSAVNAVRVFF